jgi:hypothetical protein
LAVESAKTIGVDLHYTNIRSITFVPDSNGCICIGQASDGTAACVWLSDGIPSSLAALLPKVPRSTAVQCVSVGFGGSWVVILENGAINSNGLSENLKQQLPANSQGIIQVCFP